MNLNMNDSNIFKDPLPISVIVCTLNEEDNIRACIEAILLENPYEIIIVDAESEDNTLNQILGLPKIKIINAGKKGLLYQRLSGVKVANCKIISFIDADDFIELGSLRENYFFMLENNLDGVMFQIKSLNENDYFQCGWSVHGRIITQPNQQLKMLGRPCIFKSEHIFDISAPIEPIYTEDTFIAMAQEKKFGNLNYKVGPGFTKREFPIGTSENLKKWFSYGRGDFQNMVLHKKWLSLVFHQLIRITIFRSLLSIQFSYGKHIPFFLLFGLVRFIGSFYSLFLMLKFKIKN
jgi:glycosyltransferase involved in cell wall biosynthesis